MSQEMSEMLNKSVCVRCCNEEYATGRTAEPREVIPWSEDDDANWKAGEVSCPHQVGEVPHAAALAECTRAKRHSDVLVTWDERQGHGGYLHVDVSHGFEATGVFIFDQSPDGELSLRHTETTVHEGFLRVKDERSGLR